MNFSGVRLNLLDIVIDHHPAENIDARFIDHREELAAAAAILTEYVRTLNP